MPVVETAPAVHRAVVVDRREPAPGIVVLGLTAPQLAASARAGQFVLVIVPGGERAAVALAIYEAGAGRISLMLVEVGHRTSTLAAQHVGSAVDLLGPLGNGFALEALGDDVAIVAGGVGLASLLLLAQELAQHGCRAHLYYGARSAQALVEADLFASCGVDASFATDDGSRGYHGFVTQLYASRPRRHTAIAACGPTSMLRAIATVAGERGVAAQLSLEETFACGVGACWGCVVRHSASGAGIPTNLIGATRSLPSLAQGSGPDGAFTYVRICREGPVFWADQLRW